MERRRRLKVEGILPTDPGRDGIAIGLDGQVYSDTAITAAEAQVGQLGPLNPKVAICHFPPQERAQFQVNLNLMAALVTCIKAMHKHTSNWSQLVHQLQSAAAMRIVITLMPASGYLPDSWACCDLLDATQP